MNRATARLAYLRSTFRMAPDWRLVTPVGSTGRTAHVVYADTGATAWLDWRLLRSLGPAPTPNVPLVSSDTVSDDPYRID